MSPEKNIEEYKFGHIVKYFIVFSLNYHTYTGKIYVTDSVVIANISRDRQYQNY
ncbi:hypothetical protein [Okeania sp. KiyG1]|uniref:hypothetical protein n=1 Tax=Okeania sp. KiyG1 TaxID=2720165 RepID=UPI00192372AF|nr:hypothetical protein [Okeania sp. KiyG1]